MYKDSRVGSRIAHLHHLSILSRNKRQLPKVCINNFTLQLTTNMPEAEISKEEKLRRRQEQLSKWKNRKTTATVEVPHADSITEVKPSEISPEEQKKLERRRKLEEWKRKKQEQQEKQPSGEPAKKEETPLEERQKRLEEWKKRKVNPSAEQDKNPKKPVSAGKGFIARMSGLQKKGIPAKKISVPAKRKRLFDSDDEELEEKTPFKKPVIKDLERSSKSDSEEEDALDAFVQSLEEGQNSDKTTALALSDHEGSETEGSEAESDSEDKLLSLKLKNLQKEKELSVVDHSKIEYMPFRKNFYHESQSIKDLTEEEVHELRVRLDGIRVKGTDCPRPVWSWSQLGLPSPIMSLIEEKLEYSKPTPIQSQALPAIMSGRDVLSIAKTGSGKTMAFVLPLLRHVQEQPNLAKGDGPIALLLSPTRELALQIFKQLSYFTKKLGISACCCYGGSSIEIQIAELKKGCQVVVSTPGRLIDLLAANGGRVSNLRRVTYVVLDEADRMFDFGFEPQVNKIFSQIRPDRQSILFSATFARKMEMLAKSVLQNPIEIIVGGISVVSPEITQWVELFEVDEDEDESTISARKFEKLLEVLAGFPGTKKLVFVEKQDSADRLMVKLLENDIPSLTIHGGKEQIDRKYAIKTFSSKDSGVDVLIATSIAARGLDVKGLDLVVNYDPANHMEDYVHRVGRTGRAGNTGDAYTFVTSKQERPITDLVKAMRLSKVAEDRIDKRLVEISEKFLTRVKDGEEKFRFGFGGNGLNKLDEARHTNKVLERKVYESEVGVTQKTSGAPTTEKSDPRESTAVQLDLPEFKIIEGRADETSGPDKCKFHLRITINDLPQRARWFVVNRDSLGSIIEATSTSITNKGQYYAPNTKIPTTIKSGGHSVPAPPKLYLLIEGLTEEAVKKANNLIRQKMIEGLELAAKEENLAPSGRYSV